MKTSHQNRKIIHVDMDAFYASVEQRENPKLKQKPVIVGGSPNSRAVVCAASYEARKYGIHSAMPCSQAFKKCPAGIFIQPRISLYREVSKQIRKILETVTSQIEPLSLDEAFLDVTTNKLENSSATYVAKTLQEEIKEQLNLSCSAGVSYNKFLAKIASDYRKPFGLTVIKPNQAIKFIANLPIRKFFGIGKKTEIKMKKMGIEWGRDLQKRDLLSLVKDFGNIGPHYYNLAKGIDNRPVQIFRQRKSIGVENTFSKDLVKIKEKERIIQNLATEIHQRCCQNKLFGKTLTLKLRSHLFITKSKRKSFNFPLNQINQIKKEALSLFHQLKEKDQALRLLGLSISNLNNKESNNKFSNQIEFDF